MKAETDAACTVADAIRNMVRARQHVIRCKCDDMHEVAPIQAAALRLVLDELDAVAEACIAITRRTIS